MRSDSVSTPTCNLLSGLAPLFDRGESQSTAPALEPEPELFGEADRPANMRIHNTRVGRLPAASTLCELVCLCNMKLVVA
jgi:hypothetical protein